MTCIKGGLFYILSAMFKPSLSAIHIFSLLISLLIISCQKKEEPIPQTQQPIEPIETSGFFVISSIEYPSNGRIASVSPTYSFDLGALKASDKFSFLITNGGDKPIFNVTLTSDIAPFEILPKSIRSIPGRNVGGVIQLLTINVTHGLSKTGGPAPLLAQGQNKAVIRMSGKTLVDNDTVAVTGEFTVSVDAKIVGLKIYSADQQVHDPTTNQWSVNVTSPVRMVNTGNVTIKPVLYSFIRNPTSGNYEKRVEGIFELAPNGSKELSNLLTTYDHLYIDFSDNGTVVSTPFCDRINNSDVLRILLAKQY